MLSRVDRTYFKEYMLAMVLRTTPWSKSSSYTFDVDDGGCFGCCCSSCAFFFSSTIFWAVDLLTPVSAAVLSHTDSVTVSFQTFFGSLQNLYMFSIVALASSLYLHTSFAILLSKVALHVHNTSKHAFYCKHANHKKSCIFAKAKKKKRFNWGSNHRLCYQILCVQPFFLSPYLTGLRLFCDNWRQTSRVARKVVSKHSPVIRNFLACVAKWRKVVAKILNMFKNFMRQNSSQNGRKVIAGVSNPSRTCRRPLAN